MTPRNVALAALASLTLLRGTSVGATCESLSSLALPNTTITMAQMVAAGSFVAPGRGNAPGQPLTDLPAFCRVGAALKPTIAPDIRMELWMPVDGSSAVAGGAREGGWNGKFRG